MRAAGIAGMVVLAVAAGAAQSQPGPADKPEADQLFEEGRAALAAGQHDRACDLFERSLRKDPRAVGTLLNLALCNERRGKIGTALKLYQEALARASEASLPVQSKTAQQKVTELSPRVPVLVMTYRVEPPPGAKLLVDDEVVERIGELVVDPGTHAITLTAPGRLPFAVRVEVAIGERKPVALPELEMPRSERTSPRRTFGIAATITGGGVVVLGGGLALFAKRRYDNQFDDPDPSDDEPAPCGERPTLSGTFCTPEGQDAVESARALGNAATVLVGIGAAVAITGAILWFTAPSGEGAHVVPTASGDGAGLVLVGAF